MLLKTKWNSHRTPIVPQRDRGGKEKNNRAIRQDILDFYVRELVNHSWFQPAFQTLFSLELSHPGREYVIPEAITDDKCKHDFHKSH
jgi:hypothetical protein